MAKQYRIRIRGKQREDIDLDLLAQALLMVAEDLQAEDDEEDTSGQRQLRPPEDGS